MAALKSEDGRPTTDRTVMEEICAKFYTNHFALSIALAPQVYVTKEKVSLCCSAKYALCLLNKERKISRVMNIDLVKAGKHGIWKKKFF